MLDAERVTVVDAESQSLPSDLEPSPEVDALPWHELRQTGPEVLERLQHSQLRARILGEPPPPAMVGRFCILHKLGEGGMGTVYAAYDEELDRKVALKFLHSGQSSDDHAIHRLLREAQALAKLSHPNLVTIYDVGRFEDEVYLAMELVPGLTMRAWVERDTRPWRELLERWLEVGRALASVHQAGMVHRDIKPDNVLVDEDGRARLVDFGLARGQDADRAPTTHRSDEPDPEPAPDGSRLAERVTQSHALVGTPAYMAPEVRRGEPAGQLADQYSLCVSIYQSLYGSRPPGPTRTGVLVPIPDAARAPAGLRRLLSRGLAAEPSERYPSTKALVDALERVLGRRRRWVLAGVGAVALTTAAGLGGVLARTTQVARPPVDPCAAVTDDLADVWGDARRGEVTEAIRATGLPYAEPMGHELGERLDDYASAWLDARVRVCEATRVHHTQSDALFDRRIACLDRQRSALAALIDAAIDIDARDAPRLPHALAELDAPEECEAAALAGPASSPPPELASEVEALRERVAGLNELNATPDEGVRLRDEAEQLGYRPLIAEAELQLGILYLVADDPRAGPHLRRAEALAEAEGDDLLKERALQRLALLTTDIGADLDDARFAWERDRATLRRIGDPPARVARSVRILALLHLQAGDHAAAEAAHRDEIARWAELGDRFSIAHAIAWRGLGNVLSGRGRYDEALQAFERAAQLESRWGGPALDPDQGSARVGKAAYVEGVASMGKGRLDDAEAKLRASLEQTTAAYGATSVAAGRVRVALAKVALGRGRTDEGFDHARLADENFVRWLGPDHVMRASALSALGLAAFNRGQADRAVDAFAEALRLQRSSRPPDHLDVALAGSNLGEALILAGRHQEAVEPLRAALAVMRRTLDPNDDTLSYPLHGLAQAALEQGRPEQACDHAQQALEIREQRGQDPVERARSRWLRARCLALLDQRPRAVELAQAARETFAAFDENFADEVAAIDAFLER